MEPPSLTFLGACKNGIKREEINSEQGNWNAKILISCERESAGFVWSSAGCARIPGPVYWRNRTDDGKLFAKRIKLIKKIESV